MGFKTLFRKPHRMLGRDIASRDGNDILSCFMLQNPELNAESCDPVEPIFCTLMIFIFYMIN